MLNSVGLYNLSKNTIANVSTQTGLKAVGRPGFILIDKDIDENTKKYSATKELLYQISCLAIFLALVPFINRGAYNMAKKIYKNEDVFKLFDTPKSFKEYQDLPQEKKMAKLEELIKEKNISKNPKDITKKDENLVNGVIEASSLAGSVLGLAIIAPLVCHPLIHPVLKVFGLNKEKTPNPTKSHSIKQ